MNCIFIDGVGCLGKTTAIQRMKDPKNKIDYLLMDYLEMTEKYPIFLKKFMQSEMEAAYSIKFMQEIIKTDPDFTYFVDRSPISGILYSIIIKLMNGQIKNDSESILKELKCIEVLDKYNINFIIPQEIHYYQILERMKKRNNGIDNMTLEYIDFQTKVFKLIGEQYNIFMIPSYLEIYSPDYYCWLDSILKSLYQQKQIPTEILHGNKNVYKAYMFDAGFDLRSADFLEVEANRQYKIRLQEKIIIPVGYYGEIVGRSSNQLRFSVATGIIDSNYIGDWYVFINVFRKDKILINERICQLIIKKCTKFDMITNVNFKEELQLIKDVNKQDKENYTRGTKGFGSSGKF